MQKLPWAGCPPFLLAVEPLSLGYGALGGAQVRPRLRPGPVLQGKSVLTCQKEKLRSWII